MPEQIVQKVRDAGVVGAGGAGFPTHVKIAAQVDTVIANGAECDPLLRSDQQLMAARAPEIAEGLRLVMRASGAERGVIALKREYTDAVAALLKYHLPGRRRLPVVRLNELGHVWPMAPLPLHRPVTLVCSQTGEKAGVVTIKPAWG